MRDVLEGFEAAIVPLLEWLRFGIELVAAVCIAVGFGYAVVALARAHARREPTSFKPIRLHFSRYLSLALEFQLAADILSTAIAPTLDELTQLAITAVIRTGLNYFLSKEMLQEATEREHEQRVAEHRDGPIGAAVPGPTLISAHPIERSVAP